jgi:hypothetical protein
MYTITLKDGTKIENLDMNGTNYVSQTEVDKSIFTSDNLSEMTIFDSETNEETKYEDMIFVQQMKWMDGTYYLAFREKTQEEKLAEAIINNTDSVTDLQLAIAELYETVIGG